MHVVDAELVDFVAYKLKRLARIWFNQRNKERVERAIKLIGFVFEDAFLGNFFPREKREANIKKLFKFEIGIHECAK